MTTAEAAQKYSTDGNVWNPDETKAFFAGASYMQSRILELLDEQHFTMGAKDRSLSDWLESQLKEEDGK